MSDPDTYGNNNDSNNINVTASIVSDNTSQEPALLCISDLEGCAESVFGVPNYKSLCTKTFFDALEKLLITNQKQQVVFLGDYFGVGNHIIESINGIAKLRNDTTFGNRVHIILGNRDINKLRIGVEYALMSDDVEVIDWALANPTQVSLEMGETGKTNKTEKLLGTTYGEGVLIQNLVAEHNLMVNEYNNNKETTENALQTTNNIQVVELLSNVLKSNSVDLSPIFTEFKKSVQTLFKEGKIIDVIQVGHNNVLVSHAGTNTLHGYNPKVLNTTSDSHTDTGADSKELISYFKKIESVRVKLDTIEISEPPMDVNIACQQYNGLLNEVVNELETMSVPSKMDEYILLQALGLKPTTAKYYASPIESCGINSCTHFNKMDDNFIKHLRSSGITCIAHGHKPFCCPVPLLYSDTTKADPKETINVISCDTSNGNRRYPDGINKDNFNLENVPLAIIYKDRAGITSINENGVLTQPGEVIKSAIGGVYTIKTDNTKDYKGMIDVFNFGDNFPSLLEEDRYKKIKGVKYGDLGNFMFTEGYTPADFVPHNDSRSAAGGKRKTRRHKITKNKNKRNNKKGKTLRNKKRTIRKR